MLDPFVRRLIDPPLDLAGAWLARRGVGANFLTGAGLAIGLLTLPLLAAQNYDAALLAILANRLIDGLDGAVARRTALTDFGGYFDIVADMVFYAVTVLGFALADPENAIWAAVLLTGFMGTSSSFLAWAAVAAKRGHTTTDRGRKSIYYSAGLVEGTETVLFFVAMCLWPEVFAWLAAAFAALCLWTTIVRLTAAVDAFRDE
ncbi:CDP-alcohol phosphatidyltransferase family protein [Reyranella sp. CPCC 100927]|uniref:CDP-alcohol phosphatidyltransferase family protein n=1 Tax=Reyranella sp. CPCC 100927 TaxID=2599616 RepID=UPI0011B7FA55|nr:CDP-alcohol phosphatidyltransferase family protein [Reyranella sp. CPCC 100927]TWT03805.1 CDP-alcohol phosphatidyltransferase family protein [Reyranella sp. CPCC 100927]